MLTVIDIGSNSIRAMNVSDAGAFSGKRLLTTRLAKGLDQSGKLCEESMLASVAAIARFAAEARAQGGTVWAYATSAVRDAGNREDFLARVRAACAVDIDVLSGETEARLALLGADAEGVLDVGGGSTQLVAEGFAQSWPIGCVRAAELGGRAAVEARCKSLFRFPRLRLVHWAGLGGTITTLGALQAGLSAYDAAAVRRVRLTAADVEALIERLEAMGDARCEHPLLRRRHDVILPGAWVCAFVLRGMGIESLCVSDADGMEGYYRARAGAQP